MESLSDFQKKKIHRVFNMLYDSNGDSVIDKNDVDSLLQKIGTILQWDEGSDKYQNAKTTLDTVWEKLLEIADYDKDAQITEKEWLKMWGACLAELAEKKEIPEWQNMYMELMFNVNDKSGDNFIDEKEYTTFFSTFGISKSQCKEAFGKISGGQNITQDRFKELWMEYLTSNNKSDPGNYLFGPNLDD